MAKRQSRRRSALALHKRPTARGDSIFEQLCRAIHRGELIPVIGDTIRTAHIFDVNLDEDLGVTGGSANGFDDGEVDEVDVEEELLELNVMEELAYRWAEDVGYPLNDRYRMARVAQFRVLDRENAIVAKEDYLNFLKRTLLDVAAEVARIENDPEGVELVAQLRREYTMSFADIVDELDYPLFPRGKEDPLRILARLPLKIYLTTGYFDFIERALIAEGKKPRSRLCFWNVQPENVEAEHRFDTRYEPDVANPVVYHLLGMEQYPASLVLSEDDFLDFLWQLAQDLPGDSGNRIIPPYLEAELNVSSLLLLGYRLEDWDFRVLFRGLLNSNRQAASGRGVSVAIQLDPEEQPLVNDVVKAKLYLSNYFRKASFRMKIGDSDEFVSELWQEWQRWTQGGGT